MLSSVKSLGRQEAQLGWLFLSLLAWRGSQERLTHPWGDVSPRILLSSTIRKQDWGQLRASQVGG